ncbi:3-deoxy-D-manno-octulosonic acid transferase [Cognatishimia maritima]|uniref:3-deoxy-D-manno-octulosonic acid transferase n=1 Tax=Cognatishimia maritima TaxID=870908 RepID=A0A1M5T2M4_9RHOB|nr:glycosyltransferase N-terminal domain-containing protein [Cognatishimia maritima]SHH44603.1 3-deoxy-D-manno-octulosonic-acid transferase [Cognatishimia maritima]
MAPSLSLKTYLTLARREPLAWSPNLSRDRDKALIWLHCAEPGHYRELLQLGQRLQKQRGGCQILITQGPDQPRMTDLPEGVLSCNCPSENPLDVAKFLNHWQPDVLIWKGRWLRPSLLSGAQKTGVPMVLVDASEPAIENKSLRWIPDSLRATLDLFGRIYAVDPASAFRLRRILGPQALIDDSGALQEDNPALGCVETDLEDLGEALKGRPVWLASYLHKGELEAVLTAHRASIRLSPRMVLIIVPKDPLDAGAVLTACEDGGWRVSLWDNGEMPEEKTHILLAEDARELGLFYRIAPVSFLGSSLVSGQGGSNPFEPAALGSAILYGPGISNYLEAYSRLAKAGAARIVKDADTLSAALASLMAPDKVAKMVHAGWEVVSEGALVSDRIIDHLNDAMDQRGIS